ncbi:MAG: hypothetical protein JRJ84_23990 [Deltaproteobacteria bacterium]|nr:hypothetical protein [Deltaproteobacteria bacterium]
MSPLLRLGLVLPLLLSSCNQWGDGGGCVDDGECEGLAICDPVTAQCREVDCTSSAQCALGNHCDATIHTCVTGCDADSDCLAGESCNTATSACETYGCRTTELDCSYGERCDTSSGSCYQDSDPHCLLSNDFSAQLACIYDYSGVLGCWGDIDTYGNCTGNLYCLLPCNTSDADPCPRGTNCVQAFQNDTSTYCYGDCPYLIENGF